MPDKALSPRREAYLLRLRRENPAFPRYFDAIWKELELHE